MFFSSSVSMSPGVFYGVKVDDKRKYFLPVKNIPTLSNLTSQGKSVKTRRWSYFEIEEIVHEDDVKRMVGYLFHSALPVLNLSTALLAYHVSWQSSAKKPSVSQGELLLEVKNQDFYLYHAPSKVSLVTCPSLNDSLTDFLTCI